MDFTMTNPCDECPFRADKIFPLESGQVIEIVEGGKFPCHKTLNADMEDVGEAAACAGLMILLEKENMPNQIMRIGERSGFYDRTKLNMDAPVYASIEECIEAVEE